MATVNLELPADLVAAAKLGQGNVSQEAAKLIALELFRKERSPWVARPSFVPRRWLRSQEAAKLIADWTVVNRTGL